jgi:hypothetical protein
LEKGGGLLSDSEKAEGETKEGELDENKVKCTSDTCNFLPYLLIKKKKKILPYLQIYN